MSSAYLKTTCNNCGSPTVSYSPDKSSLNCNTCKHVEPLPKNKDTITEKKLGDGFDFSTLEKGLGDAFHGKICLNPSCGAFVAISDETKWESCPFCGHEEVDEFRGKIKTMRPSAILPFSYPRTKAIAKFRNWAKGIFAPVALLEAAREPHVMGVYIPFWNFEVMTRSSWKAVQITEGPKGKKSKQPVEGFFAHFFDDLRLFASEQIDPLAWEMLGTYPLAQAVDFDPKYLEGMYTEVIQQDIMRVIKIAEKPLEKRIREQISLKAKRAAYQNLSVRSEKQLLDAKLMLLPVWIGIYGSEGNPQRVLINGITGEMLAERPYSMIKVALGVLVAVVGVIGLVVILNNLL